MNVVRHLGQGMSRLDVQRLVTTLKRPPGFAPESVEPCRPRALQPFHAGAQVWLGCLHCEVEVVSHDDKRVQPPPEFCPRLEQAGLKRLRRAVSGKQIPAVVPPIDHVVTGSRKLEAQFPRHGENPEPLQASVNSSHMTPFSGFMPFQLCRYESQNLFFLGSSAKREMDTSECMPSR